MHGQATKSYWLEESLIVGEKTRPSSGGICVIGSGVAGVAAAYWLLKDGVEVTLLDHEPHRAATFRNCGHVLYGTVESMKALKELHGDRVAKELWALSIEVCHDVRELVRLHGMDVEYKQDGYLVMAIDEHEDKEIRESVKLLNEAGFQSDYVDQKALIGLGFKNVHGARFEKGSASIHPVKYRNALLKECLKMGLKYHTGIEVQSVEEKNHVTYVHAKDGFSQSFDAIVIAANAYSPLFSDFFKSRGLVDPFAGQIITSKPLSHQFAVRHPHSFDHGYEYAIVTEDNRLMIGGWRNHVPGRDVQTYDLTPRQEIAEGLMNFVMEHYEIKEKIEWEHSWRGIMAASKTGFPFIGPVGSPLIYTVAGFTGHGMSWGTGSARLLKDIILGNGVPSIVLEKMSPERS